MARMPRGNLASNEPTLLELHKGAREHRTSTDYFHDARFREDARHLVLQLTLAGLGFYEDARGRRPLPAGSAFAQMIPGAFSYGFDPSSTGPYDLVYLGLGGAAATQWQRRLTRDFGPVLHFGDRVGAVGRQMLDLVGAYQARALPDAYMVSASLYHLLMTIYSLLRQRRVEQRPRAARAIELVNRHAGEAQFGVERLAAMLGCSREHLAREFRAATGETVARHLLRHRVRLAARLLRESDRKLEAIAHQSGFSNANYFCRVFRRQAGVTPGEFRKRDWLAVGLSASEPY